MAWTRTLLALGAAVALVACGDSHSPDDGGTMDGATRDAGQTGRDGGEDPDAGSGPDASSGVDAGPPRDGGNRMPCDAMDARRENCPAALCDGPDRWYWNGDSCFVLDCGSCVGVDCDLGVLSEMECEAAHATCRPSICEATGGTWMWWAEECGDRVCGEAVPQICLVGQPVCDCGPMATFGASGCENDVRCTMGPMMTRQQLCTSTGGSWENICCDTECGELCPDPCVSPACNCGQGQVFEAGRGCVFATRCFERTNGQSCIPGRTRCADGTICCDQCGGAGCAMMPRCISPVCDDNPKIDECGTNLLAP